MTFRPNGAQLSLVGANFLMWGGFFMVIPLVTVHFVSDLGWAAASIGTVLGIRQLTQQGLTVFGGALADRVGPKPLILVGFLTRAVGFAAMGYSTSFSTLLAASVLAGIGGSLFDAPKNAALSAVTETADLSAMFGLMGVSGNLGMVTGPLVGAALVGHEFHVVAMAAASAYLVAAVVVAVALPSVRDVANAGSGMGGLKVAALDRRFRRFTLMLVGYFALATQMNVAVILRAVDLYGEGATGPLYGVQAGLALVLQYPLLRAAERYFGPSVILVSGIVVTALALGAMSFAGTFALLLLCVAVFSLGTMVVMPTQQALTARLARPGLYGSYFGFGALSMGFGGGAGNLLGGALVDAGVHLDMPALPWLILMGIGLLSALGTRWALAGLPPEVTDGAGVAAEAEPAEPGAGERTPVEAAAGAPAASIAPPASS